MKKFILACSILAFALFSCSGTDKKEETGGSNGGFIKKSYEQFPDPKIDNGMALLAPFAVNAVGVPVDTLRFEDGDSHPTWHLCCWNFENGLSKGIRTDARYGVTFDDGTYSISRDDKGVITMSVIASKAYDKPRTEGSQPWINFLIETSFENIELRKCSNLVFSYDLLILRCDNKTGDAYSTNIHAAQCLTYLYLRNTNPESEDYMKSLWLGVGSFDNRDNGGVSLQPSTMWDVGTSTYMYGLADDRLFNTTDLLDNKWHTCKVYVKTVVKDAIRSLKEHGYMKTSVPDDFTVMGMNYGWEIPGVFDVCSQVRNFSLVSDTDLQALSE